MDKYDLFPNLRKVQDEAEIVCADASAEYAELCEARDDLAALRVPCEWRRSRHDWYDAACGFVFFPDRANPTAHIEAMKFCPGCGHPVKVVDAPEVEG